MRLTFEVENFELIKKNDTDPHLFCVLHRIGSNSYSNLAVSPFCAKKYGPGWMNGWVGGWVGGWICGKAGLRIAYSNQKLWFEPIVK